MIKQIIKRLIYKYKATSETYVAYLKAVGVECGDNITIFVPHSTTIDTLNPHLLKIGSNVAITGPATILTHDYSVFVSNHMSGGRLFGKQQTVVIGDNVFIGWGGVVLPGTIVGNNVIIGAYAVASGKLESNSVYAGNPAKRVCSMDEYIKKRENNQLKEAVDIYRLYYQRFGKIPDKSIFHEYFYLFSLQEQLTELYKSKMRENGNYVECLLYLKNNKPQFNSYEDFCEYAKNEIRRKTI